MYFKQSDCFAKKSTDEIVVNTFIQDHRMYGSFADKDEFARFILSEQPGSDFCNELLWTDSYSYCDLDCPHTLEEMGFTEATFISEFNSILIAAHKTHLNIDLHSRDILWACSSRPQKTSYHIKILCDHFWPIAERKNDMKDFFKFVNDVCLSTKGFHFYTENAGKVLLQSVLDLSVYSKNRCMRAVGCRKPTYDVRFIPVGGKITHSSIVQNLLTITDRSRMNAFQLKEKYKSKPVISLKTNVLHRLATKYNAIFQEIKGCLVILKNNGCRVCPIGGETNISDNCFFILKKNEVHFGCHNSGCCGKLIKVYEIAKPKLYNHYNDYNLLVNKKDLQKKDIEQYMLDTISFIDKPSEPHFICTNLCGVSCFKNKVYAIQASYSKSLFKGYSDITLFLQKEKPEPLKFSKILSSMLQTRRLKTYNDTVWMPFHSKNPPTTICPNKLNLFQGFVLEKLPCNNIVFEDTKMFDLLSKLCGNKQIPLDYLLNFIAAKLQFPMIKHPVAICFINSREGVGKGSFGTMLERIFACGSNSYVSFNSLESFANSFNGIQTRALFITLEEVTAKRNNLREFNGLLKDKISSTIILEEIKNRERSLRPWYASIIVFSNEFNVMSCSKTDRRLVMFESDAGHANKKTYFTELYKELEDMTFLKCAFDYFSNRNISEWNYRTFPPSKLKEKLQQCSEKHVTKFHRYLFQERISGQTVYTFTAEHLYDIYREFCELYGVQKKADRCYVCSNLELYVPMIKHDQSYTLQDSERRKYLATM